MGSLGSIFPLSRFWASLNYISWLIIALVLLREVNFTLQSKLVDAWDFGFGMTDSWGHSEGMNGRNTLDRIAQSDTVLQVFMLGSVWVSGRYTSRYCAPSALEGGFFWYILINHQDICAQLKDI